MVWSQNKCHCTQLFAWCPLLRRVTMLRVHMPEISHLYALFLLIIFKSNIQNSLLHSFLNSWMFMTCSMFDMIMASWILCGFCLDFAYLARFMSLHFIKLTTSRISIITPVIWIPPDRSFSSVTCDSISLGEFMMSWLPTTTPQNQLLTLCWIVRSR